MYWMNKSKIVFRNIFWDSKNYIKFSDLKPPLVFSCIQYYNSSEKVGFGILEKVLIKIKNVKSQKKAGFCAIFRIFQILIAFRTLISDKSHHDQYFWDLQYTSGIRNQWTLRRFQILVLSCIAYDATTFSIAKLSKIPCSDIRYVRVKVTLTVKPIYSLIFLYVVCFQKIYLTAFFFSFHLLK